MKINMRSTALPIFIALLFCYSCDEKIPIKEMALAKHEIVKARSVKAKHYAPDEFKEAKEKLFECHELIKADKEFRITNEKNEKIINELRELLDSKRSSIPIPQKISMKFTNNCNLKCQVCDIWKESRPKELTTDQWKDAISKIYAWLGPYHLDIAGGEPLLRNDIEELISFCGDLGISTALLSNGTLITESRAQKLIGSGLDNINISLDSLKPEVYDSLRGIPGTHQKVIKALKLLKKHRSLREKPLGICIATIIMTDNLEELPQIVEFVKQGGSDSICFQALDNNFHADYDPKWYDKNRHWIKDLDKLNKTIDKIIEMKVNNYPISNPVEQLEHMKQYFCDPDRFVSELKCKSGEKNLIIDSDGGTKLCWYSPSIGDILSNSPKTLWEGEKSRKIRAWIEKCEKTCKISNCHFLGSK